MAKFQVTFRVTGLEADSTEEATSKALEHVTSNPGSTTTFVEPDYDPYEHEDVDDAAEYNLSN